MTKSNAVSAALSSRASTTPRKRARWRSSETRQERSRAAGFRVERGCAVKLTLVGGCGGTSQRGDCHEIPVVISSRLVATASEATIVCRSLAILLGWYWRGKYGSGSVGSLKDKG
jgi:hypothetical protein